MLYTFCGFSMFVVAFKMRFAIIISSCIRFALFLFLSFTHSLISSFSVSQCVVAAAGVFRCSYSLCVQWFLMCTCTVYCVGKNVSSGARDPCIHIMCISPLNVVCSLLVLRPLHTLDSYTVHTANKNHFVRAMRNVFRVLNHLSFSIDI